MAGVSHLGIVKPPAILQLAIRVEPEKVWCAHRAVGLAYRLILIHEVGKGELMVCRKALHHRRAVLRDILVIIGHDRDDVDAFLLQGVGIRHEARDNGLDVRTVVTDKGHDEALVSLNVGETEDLSIRVSQSKRGLRSIPFLPLGYRVTFFQSPLLIPKCESDAGLTFMGKAFAAIMMTKAGCPLMPSFMFFLLVEVMKVNCLYQLV